MKRTVAFFWRTIIGLILIFLWTILLSDFIEPSFMYVVFIVLFTNFQYIFIEKGIQKWKGRRKNVRGYNLGLTNIKKGNKK